MVRWSWNSTDDKPGHNIDTIEDFNHMINSEGWTEDNND